LLQQKIVDEQRWLLGNMTAPPQRKCEIKEHSSSTFLADDDSLLFTEVNTGSWIITIYTECNLKMHFIIIIIIIIIIILLL